MSDAIIQVLKKRYHLGHERILKMIEGLTDEQFAICRNPAESDSEHIVCSHVVSQIAHNEFHRGQIASIRRAMNLPRVWRW